MPYTPPRLSAEEEAYDSNLGHEGWVGAATHIFENSALQGPHVAENKMKEILNQIEAKADHPVVTISNAKKHGSMANKYEERIKHGVKGAKEPGYRAKDRIRATVISNKKKTDDLKDLQKEIIKILKASQAVDDVAGIELKDSSQNTGYQDIKVYFKLKVPTSNSTNVAKASRNQNFLKGELFEIIIITAVTYVAKSGSASLKKIIGWSSKYDEDDFKNEGQKLFSGTLKDIGGEGHTFYKMDAIPQIPKYLTWHENFPNFYYKYFRTNEAGPEKMALINTLEEHQNRIKEDESSLSGYYTRVMDEKIKEMLKNLRK